MRPHATACDRMRPLCELMRTYAPFLNNKYNNKNKKKNNNKFNLILIFIIKLIYI